MSSQRTLKSAVTLTGVGLHSGRPATVTVRPAEVNHGIVFVRKDMIGSSPIPAHFQNIVSTQMATTLGKGAATISTVEHLMAALHGAQIDNALVEVSGPEMPILDGSSGPFLEAFSSVGTIAQGCERARLVLRRKVEVKIGDKLAVAEPSSKLEVHGSVDWKHPAIGHQEFHYIADQTDFSDIAFARTFGFLRDVEMLKKMGLARGGSLDNAVVLDDIQVLNPDGLRYENEFARHKVLDALGDFMLAGISIQAYIHLDRAGHDLHSQLLAAIFANPDNYEVIGGDRSYERDERRAIGIRAALAGLAASVS